MIYLFDTPGLSDGCRTVARHASDLSEHNVHDIA